MDLNIFRQEDDRIVQKAQKKYTRLPRLQSLVDPCRYKFIPFFGEDRWPLSA